MKDKRVTDIKKMWSRGVIKAADDWRQGYMTVAFNRGGNYAEKAKVIKRLDKQFIDKIEELEHYRDETIAGPPELNI